MKNKILVFFLCAVLCFQGPLFAELSWKDLNLPSNLFPTSSPSYTIKSVREDPAAPGFLIFTASADGKTVDVEGLVDLQKWMRETTVIAELDKDQNATEGVVDGAAESIKGTGRGLKNLVFHPVDSVKGIGKATGKLGGKIGDAFSEKEEGEKGDTFLSSTKRQIAKKLGVDVYSRNPALQEKLGALAKQQMGGRGIVMVATFFMPLGLLASAVMTASNINNAADELVDDKDRADLFEINKDALLALGFSLKKTRALLNHPYYTPREVTYIRFYLEKLRRLRGAEGLLDQAIILTAPVPAQKFLHEMQIAADNLDTLADAQAVRVVPSGILLERRNSVVLITGYDFLGDSPLGDRIVKEVTGYKGKLGKSSAEIWSGGTVTAKLGGELINKGIKVRRMCLFKNASSTKDPMGE